MPQRDDELRRYPRINSQHAVLVKKLDRPADEALTKTRTVGLGGCMFVNDEPVGEGAPVEIFIAVSGEAVRAKSRVVWERPHDGGGWEIGVEFLEISDEHRKVLETLFA